jgi:hypothetical protein
MARTADLSAWRLRRALRLVRGGQLAAVINIGRSARAIPLATWRLRGACFPAKAESHSWPCFGMLAGADHGIPKRSQQGQPQNPGFQE